MSRPTLPIDILTSRQSFPEAQYLDLTRRALGGLPDDFGTEIGYGGDQFVYVPVGHEHRVAKLIFSTLTYSMDHAAEMESTLSRRHDLLVGSVGDYVLPTGYSVRELDTGAYIVAAEQPFVSDGQSVTTKEGVSTEAINGLDNPPVQVIDFIAGARTHRTRYGEGIDIYGEGNLLVSSGRLLLVDTLTQTEAVCTAPQPHGVTIGEAIDLSYEVLADAVAN